MSKPKPTILVVHGAFNKPVYYDVFAETLQKRGYEVVCPFLPTCNGADPPNATLAEDVALIHKTAKDLLSEGKEVVGLAHSYGGVVATDAFHGLAIKRMIFVAAFIPITGEGLAQIFDGKDLPKWMILDGPALRYKDDAEEYWFHDVPEPEKWGKHLVPIHPLAAHWMPVKANAWKTIPLTYIVTENDRTVQPGAQTWMVERIKERGIDVDVETIASGHHPGLAQPEEFADMIERIVQT